MKYTDGSSTKAFTLIELLVVVAIIAVLVGILLPSLMKARAYAAEQVCASNLRQMTLSAFMYADTNSEKFPLEPWEHNPHPGLVSLLTEFNPGILDSCYCPQADYLETFANDPNGGEPNGATNSVIDTPENRSAGNISYVYWSFSENKPFESQTWLNPAFFVPRQLKIDGIIDIKPSSYPDANPSERWAATDFFRRGAPFPHTRKHAEGLNVAFLDGHIALIVGKPKLNYR